MADLVDTVIGHSRRLEWIEGSVTRLVRERDDVGGMLLQLDERTKEIAGPHPAVMMRFDTLQRTVDTLVDINAALTDAVQGAEARIAVLERPGLLRRALRWLF